MAFYWISGNILQADVIRGSIPHKFLIFVGTTIYWGQHILRRSNYNGM